MLRLDQVLIGLLSFAFRNLANCYVVDANEVNAYLVSTFSSVIIEKAALKTITKEG